MLRELRIENLLLIERAELRLGAGLNAITGETGAGKTVLAHSLDLLMGGKARAQIVRPGAEEAWVEGVFELPEGLLDEPELAEIAERLPEGAEEVVLGRRVSAGGRTSAFVAGRAASAADLKLLGGRLLAFYGQHEHRKLTISSAQLEILDGFAGAEHLELRRDYREAHRECLRLAAELAELRERDGSRERDLDLYRYELSEIEAVAPDPEEAGAGRASASACATPRACASRRRAPTRGLARRRGGRRRRRRRLARPKRRCRARRGSTRRSTRWPSGSPRSRVELGDVAAELRDYAEGVEADPGALLAVEERLDALDRLRAQARRQRRVGAGPRGALPRRDRAAGGRRGAPGRGRGGAGRGRGAAGGARATAERGPAKRRPEPLEKRVADGARAAGDAGRDAARSCSSRTPTASAPRAGRRSSCGWRRTPGSSRRRCATRPRAASSRG